MTATSNMTARSKTARGWRWPDLEVAVVEPALCKGCPYCDALMKGGSAKPAILCSNMRVVGVPAESFTKEGAYRLTTADLVFLSELGV
jgi:hypothetical protein